MVQAWQRQGVDSLACEGWAVRFYSVERNKRITQQNKTKNKNMKATKQNKTQKQNMEATDENKYASVDFTSLDPIMDGIWKGECSLMNALRKIWNAQADKSAPLEFRKAFVAHAVRKGYSEKWAGEVAHAAGFQIRASGGGRKPKSDAEKRKARIAKLKAELKDLKLTKSELEEFVSDLAKR
jgi:hypothetical protein